MFTTTQIFIVEALMIASAIIGWYLHSSFAQSIITKVEAELSKVTSSATPATPAVSTAPTTNG